MGIPADIGAHISEEDGKTIISGEIVYNPDENGNEMPTAKLSFGDYVYIVILYPLAILISLLQFIVRLITKKPKSKTEKLDDFMVNYLGCTKIKAWFHFIYNGGIIIVAGLPAPLRFGVMCPRGDVLFNFPLFVIRVPYNLSFLFEFSQKCNYPVLLL